MSPIEPGTLWLTRNGTRYHSRHVQKQPNGWPLEGKQTIKLMDDIGLVIASIDHVMDSALEKKRNIVYSISPTTIGWIFDWDILERLDA